MFNRNTKPLTTTLLIALLLLSLAACSDGPTDSPPPPPPPLSLNFPNIETSECDAVSVPMTVQNFSAVSGLELRVAYDTLKMTFDSLSSGHFDIEYVYDSAGVVRFMWADISMIKPIILADDDTLLWFHYSSLSGMSPLTFEEPIHVVDTVGADLLLGLTDGSITCTGE